MRKNLKEKGASLGLLLDDARKEIRQHRPDMAKPALKEAKKIIADLQKKSTEMEKDLKGMREVK
jgi:hypothetical protein